MLQSVHALGAVHNGPSQGRQEGAQPCAPARRMPHLCVLPTRQGHFLELRVGHRQRSLCRAPMAEPPEWLSL